jgi:hypothetical protein
MSVRFETDNDDIYVCLDDVRGIDPTRISSHDMIAAVLEWMRGLDTPLFANVMSAILLEFKGSVHINTTTEEERIQSLNMQHDDLIMVFVRALAAASGRDTENPSSPIYATVGDIHTKLQEWHTDVPSYVIYTFLKTMEYFTGRVVDVDEGYFRLVETGQLVISEDKRVSMLKREIDALSEEGRDLVQTHVVFSLQKTKYAI